MRTASVSFLLISLILVPVVTFAAFSDVPASHRYAVAIESLVSVGVVKGNDDGTFRPDHGVNRAELLTMLYRARPDLIPAPPAKQCKSDVPRSAWFEAVVCDAIIRGFVNGYPDGTFKPEKEVNRVEALKMIRNVLSLPAGGVSTQAVNAIPYTDVPKDAWFVVYVASALVDKSLPFPSEGTAKLKPDAVLTRGEASFLIAKGLGLKTEKTATASAASSAAAAAQGRSSRAAASASTVKTEDVTVPFTKNGTFDLKQPVIYRFTLKDTMTVHTDVSVTAGQVTCRLYKIGSNGISEEYYLGHQSDTTCVIRTTLTSGNYQLEVKPTNAEIGYYVNVKEVSGDGNDGFSQAKTLLPGVPKPGVLEAGDTGDWFTFKLSAKTSMTVEVTNTPRVACIVYALSNVDIFGFVQPECNVPYDYPAGTYVIGVIRGDSKEEQDYSVRMK